MTKKPGQNHTIPDIRGTRLRAMRKGQMGENGEGSSNAAQSAPSEDQIEPNKRTGLLSRLFKRDTSTSVQDQTSALADPAPLARPTHGMVNLRRMRIEDVAIPKAEITAVPDTITRDELVQLFRDSGMTRLPVYQGTLDTPIGLIHLKDFALRHGFNAKGERFDLKSMLRPLLFVPPSMPIGVLLQKMQTERRHMALVIDEYGGVDGLVTIEDLIEQVIGEIEDEHDVDEDQLWTQEKTGAYLALAKTPLDSFEDATSVSLTSHDSVDEEEIDTLGGLVFMLSGRVPVRGEVVQHPAGHEFEVVDADPRRIKRLRVRLRDPNDPNIAGPVAVAPLNTADATMAERPDQGMDNGPGAGGPTGQTPANAAGDPKGEAPDRARDGVGGTDDDVNAGPTAKLTDAQAADLAPLASPDTAGEPVPEKAPDPDESTVDVANKVAAQ